MTYTKLHFYKVEIFYVALDKVCVEMNHRFSKASNEALDCFSCLSTKNLSQCLMLRSLLAYLAYIMRISLMVIVQP
jgi:hypothetical protein